MFTRELRGKRLLREVYLLKEVTHPCLNKLKAIVKPKTYENFNDVYLVLELCDMDMKKLLKSNRYLEEDQVKSIVYDILCGLKYMHHN